MGGKKTCGKKQVLISNIIKLAKKAEIEVREGSNHKYVLNAPGMMACAVGPTSDFAKHIAPWMKKVTGYSRQVVYQSADSGKWKF